LHVSGWAAYEAVPAAHSEAVSNLPAVAVPPGSLRGQRAGRPHTGSGSDRKIGSAARLNDGLHARTDGFTSWPSVGRRVGAGLRTGPTGRWTADTVRHLAVLRQADARSNRRLMDAVDPALAIRPSRQLRAGPGCLESGRYVSAGRPPSGPKCENRHDPRRHRRPEPTDHVAAEARLLHRGAAPAAASIVHARPAALPGHRLSWTFAQHR